MTTSAFGRKMHRLNSGDQAGGRVAGMDVVLGVISRADIVNAFTKPDEVIEDEIREDIVRRLLFLDPAVVQVSVKDKIAVVVYDDASVDVNALTGATARSGFRSTPVR